MDLGLNRRRKQQKVVHDALQELYPHDMSLYRIPPGNEITLSEFEDLALDRLKVLRVLGFASQKGMKIYSAEWKSFIYEELQKQGLKKYLRIIRSSGANNSNDLDYQARRADHISHFILRIAYCRTDTLRRWFLMRELELFRLRFLELSAQGVQHFLEINDLHYTPISDYEKVQLREELNESTGGLFVIDNTSFYKVPFTEVTALVRNRKVFLKDGFAYVPNFELVSCVGTIFRAHLSASLAYANTKIPQLDDDRLNALLNNLHSLYTGNDYTDQTDKTQVKPANLDLYSREHFPMCMRHIHEMFRANHHLKHGCRMQYGLFLKGIGLSFEDCLEYWREEFTKIMDADKFDKQYSYGVKHSYGKVGSRVNYTPYSCMKIIQESVTTGQHHGCPFKHWDVQIVKQRLEEYGMAPHGVVEVTEMAQKGHYQLACGKYFQFMHGRESKNVINHPNQYFEESFGNEGKAAKEVKKEAQNQAVKEVKKEAQSQAVKEVKKEAQSQAGKEVKKEDESEAVMMET